MTEVEFYPDHKNYMYDGGQCQICDNELPSYAIMADTWTGHENLKPRDFVADIYWRTDQMWHAIDELRGLLKKCERKKKIR